MLSFTSYTKVGMRLAELLGILMSGGSALAAVVCLILKLVDTDWITGPIAPVVLTVLFVGGLQLFFLGFAGEYIMSMNARVMKRPLVIEEERLNFEGAAQKQETNV